MTDLISRADAIEAVCRTRCGDKAKGCPAHSCLVIEEFDALPSAETHEIRTETHGVCLISKDDAMGAVQDHFNDNGFKGYDDGQKMMDRIKALPSADAVQGEWIDIDNYYRLATCSRCHMVTMFEKWGEYIKPYDFCPNCGARMKRR